MFISRQSYDMLVRENHSLIVKVSDLGKRLEEYQPKPKKFPCQKCGTMTEHIPTTNVKYCQSCAWTIQQTR